MAGTPLLSYLRYNLDLSKESVRQYDPSVNDDQIAGLSEMDAPANMRILHGLGIVAAARDIHSHDFPSHFDLPAWRAGLLEVFS